MSNGFLKILVVEDSKSLAEHYQNVLESQGHKVFVTHDGKEELEVYAREMKSCNSGQLPFDLIISDNSMPEMNGVEAGKKILDMMPTQKFFFVTGEKNVVLGSLNVDGKNIDVEQKPLKTELFLKKINTLIQN